LAAGKGKNLGWYFASEVHLATFGSNEFRVRITGKSTFSGLIVTCSHTEIVTIGRTRTKDICWFRRSLGWGDASATVGSGRTGVDLMIRGSRWLLTRKGGECIGVLNLSGSR